MSVSINQQVINRMTDLSQSTQYVIALLPEATSLFTRVLQTPTLSLDFPSELALVRDIWSGSYGSETCFNAQLNTWVSPTTLFHLTQEELASLSQSITQKKSSKSIQAFAALTARYHWITQADLSKIGQFKSMYSLEENPYFSTMGLDDLTSLKEEVLDRDVLDATLKEALSFAQRHANNGAGLIDLVVFYLNASRLLTEGDSGNVEKLSGVYKLLVPEIEKYLTAPMNSTPLDEGELNSTLTQWLSEHTIIGFKDVTTGCRIISGLVELNPDSPEQAVAKVPNAIDCITSFFRDNSAQFAYPSQSANDWVYHFADTEYSGTLRWVQSGVLCLQRFSPLAVQKVVKKTVTRAKPRAKQPVTKAAVSASPKKAG